MLKRFYADFELNFNSLHFVGWAESNIMWAFVISGVYVALALWLGPLLMQSRKPIPCKNQLAVWNLLLAVFSAVGFLRTAPHLLYFGWKFGVYASVCAPAETSFGQGAVGFWTMLFIFSKIPELVDTLFLVIAKKDVIFLHWYHHFSVLLYCQCSLFSPALFAQCTCALSFPFHTSLYRLCSLLVPSHSSLSGWHSYATRSSAGLYFVSMNYGVHALMYFYFFLTSCGYKPRWNGVVTFLQISQMFVGVAVCFGVAYYMFFVSVMSNNSPSGAPLEKTCRPYPHPHTMCPFTHTPQKIRRREYPAI